MKPLHIVHLYPQEMNIYGDTGNRIVLEKRLSWRKLPYKTTLVGINQEIPSDADIVIGGGGQDAAQGGIEKDLHKKGKVLRALAIDGVPMLMVCGMYQLFGNVFITQDGKKIKGLGILDIETRAGEGRLIGNIVADMFEVGTIVGYENHSGRTYLGELVQPFARVIAGAGNDDSAELEGARFKNVFGTYMHGPILSKNPAFADYILSTALKRKGWSGELTVLDDAIETQAHEHALLRPR